MFETFQAEGNPELGFGTGATELNMEIKANASNVIFFFNLF
jgi:hypothetical protein